MKVKNEYTVSLKSPSKYNPNDFTATGTAIFYVVLVVTMLGIPCFFKFIGFSDWLTKLAGMDYFLATYINIVLSQLILVLFGLGYSLLKRVNSVEGGGYYCAFDFTQILFGCLLVVGIQLCFSSLHVSYH